MKVYLVQWTYDEQSGVEAVCASPEVGERARQKVLLDHARPPGDPETWPSVRDFQWPPLGPDDVSVQEWEVAP